MNKLPKNVDWVWNARWTSYWINDEELFDFTKKDFDKRSRELKEAGINAVIIFGSFHFRWGFIDDWGTISTVIRKVCESCHEYGIKVVDHHSANLISAPLGEKEWSSRLHENKRGLSPKRHPKYLELLRTGDGIFKGIRLSSMYQIDPRSGSFSRTAYKGWVMCHNNPDYQRLYFEYLEEIYGCGVDGIMSDDIAFWPRFYGCGCIYCRNKFKEDTGYEMPPSGLNDESFYNNLENPAYREWILWRLECNLEHQQRVFDHFHSLGLELARPIYHSSNTNSYAPRGMGTALDNLDGLYSTIFTEVNVGEPQAHSWLRIGAESKQRNALGCRNGVPSMCLFYPSNKVENLFCWAITKTWGQSYWGTNRKLTIKEEMDMVKVGFNFESTYPELYLHPESIAEVAVLFSARTVWLHDDNDDQSQSVNKSTGMNDPASTDCWAGWCEVLALANIQFDTIGENDLEEKRYFNRLRLIIVPNAVCLSDKAMEALKVFVSQGGKTIITHQTGLKNENGEWRKEQAISDLTGATYEKTVDSSPDWIGLEGNKVATKRYDPEKTPTAVFKLEKETRSLMVLEDRSAPALFQHTLGKGEVLTFAGKPGRIVCINRHRRVGEDGKPFTKKEGKSFSKIDFYMNPNIVKLMEDSVRYLLGKVLQLETDGVPRGFVIGIFGHGARTVLHITNTAGVLADSGKTVILPASALVFPQADSLPGGKKRMIFKIRRKGDKAVLRSPEFSGEIELACHREGEYVTIEVSADMVKCYSVIELR